MADSEKNQKEPESIYLPTKAEERLLAVLTNPASRLWPINEIWKAAKINKDTYYKSIKKPGFRKLCDEVTREVLHNANTQAAHAFVREAVRGSYPHLKTLFEINGIYKPKDSGDRLADTFERWLDSIKGEKGQ